MSSEHPRSSSSSRIDKYDAQHMRDIAVLRTMLEALAITVQRLEGRLDEHAAQHTEVAAKAGEALSAATRALEDAGRALAGATTQPISVGTPGVPGSTGPHTSVVETSDRKRDAIVVGGSVTGGGLLVVILEWLARKFGG